MFCMTKMHREFCEMPFSLLPGVPGIVAQVASLLSQPACVFRQKYRTDKYLLCHKVMLPHPV
jgi:hypothetical protein